MLFTPEILEKIRRELETATNEYGLQIVSQNGYIVDIEAPKLVIERIAAKEGGVIPSNWVKMLMGLMRALDFYEADADYDGQISLDEFMECLKNIE